MQTSSSSTVPISDGGSCSKINGGCCAASSELVTTELSCRLALFTKEASAHQAPAAVQFTAIWFGSVEKQMEQQWTNLQFVKVQPAEVL